MQEKICETVDTEQAILYNIRSESGGGVPKISSGTIRCRYLKLAQRATMKGARAASLIALLVAAGAGSAEAQPTTFYGPTPYFSPADSPFTAGG